MNFSKYVVVTLQGQVIREYTGQTAPMADTNEQVLNVGLDNSDYLSKYYKNNKFCPLPTKPNEYSVFNVAKEVWEDGRSTEHLWESIKYLRSQKLTESDWVVVKAQETGTVVPEAWLNYRQALRDITLQANPLKIVWPVAP